MTIQDIPNDPAYDAAQKPEMVSYQEQYRRMQDDAAPLRGIYSDIACEIDCLEQNAVQNHDHRARYDPEAVTR